MMFLTFGEKCGDLGASAFSGVSAAPANSRSLTSDASAMVPKPVPHSLKKCRRVIAAKISELNLLFFSSLITCCSSLLSNRLIQIQQNIRKHGPGRFLPNRAAFGPGEVAHQIERLFGVYALFKTVGLLRPIRHQLLDFGGLGLPSQTQAEP